MNTPTNSPKVTVNPEMGLYVIPCAGGGCTTLGIHRLEVMLTQMAELMEKPVSSDTEPGTPERYRTYLAVLHEFSSHPASKKTWFDSRTPPKVKTVLEKLRGDRNHLVRLWYGDPETGRAWLEECDTIGIVSRSGGVLKSPILLVQPGAFSGPIISTSNILRIDLLQGDRRGHLKTLWKHKSFYHPELRISTFSATLEGYYDVDVTKENDERECVARFKTYPEACAWIAWMNGVSYPETDISCLPPEEA
ncbi:MAG: hypothetical protein QM680_07335 [Luteolibacter sp.]